ncbi:MAG: hypothetical protein EAZ97_07015 [Bacteroidetes bacterium]|nr:MAG: hypothetical protein EAZ97_07015 [Bacteroidota bacterium]
MSVFGQKKEDKALIKEWKKKKKALHPLEFKKIVEKYDSLSRIRVKLSREIEKVGLALEEQDKINQQFSSQTDSIRSERTGRNVQSETDEMDVADNSEFEKGVVFKVQIGGNENMNKEFFKQNSKNYMVETDQNGMYSYTLGYFRKYWDADNFKSKLRKMGLKDAKVSAYKDNKKVEITDVIYQSQTAAPKE